MFPNSGIRSKVFVRKIGFKLRVMRLNRVESFYAFLLYFCSERSEEGRPTMTMSPARVAGHGQGPCRGDWLCPRPHASAAARKRATASRCNRPLRAGRRPRRRPLRGQRQHAREAPTGTTPEGARPPTGAVVPVAKGAARGLGGRQRSVAQSLVRRRRR
ncbi:hypothetical protein GW17_00052559 [Ensete ventricosum]|nr:hypothetical protein GW17_00052559 [Ensete ventricosum]RZR93155.1 hypothetical protein BHM03_00021586 [Ensete ventricosum]